jgi:alpha-L-arabinofuranosidase
MSLFVGHGWWINSIRVDPAAKADPYYFPQGLAITFYNHRHGHHRLQVDRENVPTYDQPYSMGWFQCQPYKAAWLDVVATADSDRVFIHAINRHLEKTVRLQADLSALAPLGATGTHHMLSGRFREDANGKCDVCEIRSRPLAVPGTTLVLDLEPRAAHILEIPLAP